MTGEPPFEPERVIGALNGVGVRYVVVGGLAAGAHGVVRATRDLDLIPEPGADNMARLAAALTAIGAQHPIEGKLTAESLARPVSLELTTRHGDVHVLNRMPGAPPYERLERERLLVSVAPDIEVSVCSLAHLRDMKRVSSRPRDQVDLFELDALHGPEDTG